MFPVVFQNHWEGLSNMSNYLMYQMFLPEILKSLLGNEKLVNFDLKGSIALMVDNK